ncbi:unnamed protein product [Moneuplotes crassus]|uniref:Thioredoxin domain-containing protein n=1 Tax=Euplotes crassus TaxID=5936 RepID=A0AAD1Y3F5_EUPCR|nr:unnamed protein product [Moneuplotes crassus]
MDYLLGETFLRGLDTIDLEEMLHSKEFVGIYFGAHWCPPSRSFTTVLKNTYEEINNEEKVFEVIFVSFDGNEAAFERNYMDMPWCAIGYNDSRAKLFKQQFGITGIPTLVILNKKGEIITYDGRADVQSMRAECIEEWRNTQI